MLVARHDPSLSEGEAEQSEMETRLRRAATHCEHALWEGDRAMVLIAADGQPERGIQYCLRTTSDLIHRYAADLAAETSKWPGPGLTKGDSALAAKLLAKAWATMDIMKRFAKSAQDAAARQADD